MIDYPEYTLSQPPSCPRNQDHLKMSWRARAFASGAHVLERWPLAA